jgi:hypothetical protein
MAKSKKSKKGSKKGGIAARHETLKSMTPVQRSQTSPRARTAFLIHTTNKTDEQIAAMVKKEFKDAASGYTDGTHVKLTRSALEHGHDGFAWVKKANHVGESYFGHGAPKPKKAPAKKTPKPKKVAGKKKAANTSRRVV